MMNIDSLSSHSRKASKVVSKIKLGLCEKMYCSAEDDALKKFIVLSGSFVSST